MVTKTRSVEDSLHKAEPHKKKFYKLIRKFVVLNIIVR